MEYTDYMGLPDDMFFVEVFKLYLFILNLGGIYEI